ncbi:arylsulfatase [Luteibacter sp. OK325]|uniref:arylsulfatase n=1 Tax=Luteibacter sp. OK325 TaxID=2135670 RepID=UPI0018EE5BFA|nr:arylsulfatase [Luteibacter sp. OK325]
MSDTLPVPEPRFKGRIGNTYVDSEADVLTLRTPPEGAPNILLVLLDDVGFGQASTFGGPANTPTLEKLATQGLRYNRFHTTALCSPTRAALLSGRNHHSVHSGVITEMATGFPGYDGCWPREAASIAEILQGNRYATAAFGKWHNTPDHELSAAGPFDRWPTGKGFGYWYGFQGGEASQWHTPLFENTAPIEPPHDDPGWHFSEAIADRAISWIGQQQAAAPDMPFFAYFAPGACHSPHHVAREWSDKYKGKFDHGWDRQRQITLDRQKALGLLPAGTKLTPRPDSIPAWETCSADEKTLYARMQEVFAGFLEHVDAQVGRVVDAIEHMGLRDNTLIIYIVGDNGPSAEGSLTGTLNNMKTQLGLLDDVSTILSHIDEIGGPLHENHYPVGWAWAGSSPFQWMKQVASHFGGTRNGLVISWPNVITDHGALRTQFHHAIDIVPTLLDAAGIPEPRSVNGVPQKPIEGISMAYTFDRADAPSRRVTQYFEMLGNRAIYHDGWVAGCLHGRLPWLTSGGANFDDDTWELYNIEDDFSQSNDLARKELTRLRDLQDRFMAEAARYDVLPLDDRFAQRADPALKPSHMRGKKHFVYTPGVIRIGERSSPNTKNVHHTLAVEVTIPKGGSDGVLVCCGGIPGGYSLFIKDGKLYWEHNYYNDVRYRVESEGVIPTGHHVLSAEIKVDEEGKFGTGGTVTLRVDKATVGTGRFEQQVAGYFTVNETFDVGCDTVSPVSDLYQSPFKFTGEIVKVMVDVSETTFEELAGQHELHARWALATQ